ncbi:hypothetical protein, conserved [Eimeria tenella]|uniref:Uncharacterized protein n=1 Tax=Eimeria tenella TaxID=5802 RepID=U6L1L4_EIMTE|nr:hypothetical protein, conserved [Eimeria tenella]CDJ44302.1 hypothetical protein, conserved [Eimeria tenella]|eukprot:XP_013235051.1 hypothetical protein, conserved [Eimeria tenella]
MVNVCNDGEELASLNFFWFSPKEEGGSCSVGDVSVCMAYKNLFSTLSAAAAAAKVDWSSSALAACRGPQAAGLAPEAFMLSSDDSSDLYRYLLMFCICWNITFLTLTLFFFYIKYSSKMDSIFFLPKRPKENLLLKIFRPFSPFTR